MTVPEEPQPKIDVRKPASNAADPTTVFQPGQQPSDGGYSYPPTDVPPAPPAAPQPGVYGYAYPPAPTPPPAPIAPPPYGGPQPPPYGSPQPPPYGGYPQQPPPYQPYGYRPPAAETPVFSIVGFVCAVLTLGFLVFCWFGVFLTGPLGIIFGVIGHNKGEELGKWAAIASGVTMALGVALGLLIFGLVLSA